MALRLFKRIFLPSLIGAVAIYFLTGLLPKSYASYQTLYFPLNPAGGVGALGPIAGAPSGGDAGAVPGLEGAIMYPLIGSGSQTASGIINSHSCREEVARRLHLPKRWNVSLLNASKRLSGQIIAESDRTGMLFIRVTSESPSLCVAINQEIYRHLERRTAELSTRASIGNRKLVQQRLVAAQRELGDSKGKVIAVMRNSPLAAVEDVQKRFLAAQKALADAKGGRDQARAGLDALEFEYQRLAQAGDVGTTMNALTTLNPAFAELAQELQRRRLELADAMITFSASSPRVFRAREAYTNAEKIAAQVKTRAASREGVVSPDVVRARAEMAGLEAAVRTNESALEAALKAISASPAQYAESAIAKDNFQAALARVAFLKQELEKAVVIENRNPSRFEVVDEPFEDPTPTAPHRALFAGLAFAAIAAAGFVPLLIGLVRAAEFDSFTPQDAVDGSDR